VDTLLVINLHISLTARLIFAGI